MQGFLEWTSREPAQLFDLYSAADRDDLSTIYGGARNDLFGSVLAHADRAGARSVLVEHRYIDADYRSEHSRFYSTTFRRYPSIAHRLHFFESELTADHLDLLKPAEFSGLGYMGYCVVRPVEASPVGRTMIRPTSELDGHVSCVVPDEVNLFGSRLTTTAAPFMAQDFQLGVCVHVTAWVCAYYHHLRFGAPRVLPADLAGYTPMEHGRLVPSGAVTITQLVQILERAGLPPVVYRIAHLPRGEKVESIACRYLDSGLPVIAAGRGHVFALMGYRWVRQDGRRRLQFIRQDDLEGPYVVVDGLNSDQYRPWEYLIVPLPAKVYMSGERAESLGRRKLLEALGECDDPEAAGLLEGIEGRRLEFRTTVLRSNEFKAKMTDHQDALIEAGRQVEADARAPLAAAYQWIPMSRWVWVVELVDCQAWYANAPSVVAEAIIDATGHAEDQKVLAWRVPGIVSWILPDFEDSDTAEVNLSGPQPSVASTNTAVTEL